MKLLVFAHRGEAQAFLKKLDLKMIEDNLLYKNEETLLLITGEGIQNTTETLSYTLSKYEVSEIINFGIVGGLKNQEKYSIYSIRTAYHHHTEPSFHSFSSVDKEATEDCVSYYKRVTQSLEKEKVSHIAPLIDRELWAIGSVAKRFKLPWRSYKIVSDITAEQTDCADIFENAFEFSQRLYQSTSEDEEGFVKKLEDQGFWITFTESKRIEKLFKIAQPDYSEISNSEMTGKQKTQKLIELLEQSVDPITFKIRKNIKKRIQTNNNLKIHYSVDNQLEKNSVKVKSTIESEEDIKNLIESLQKFPLKDIQSMIDGEVQ